MRRNANGRPLFSIMRSVASCERLWWKSAVGDGLTIERYASRPTPTSAAASTNDWCAAMRASTASCTLTMNTRSPGRSAARTEAGSRKSATTTSAPGSSGARAASRTNSVCSRPSRASSDAIIPPTLPLAPVTTRRGSSRVVIGVTVPARERPATRAAQA